MHGATGLEDVWAFNWCGSAVLGGYLLDAYGFQVSFALTAGLQLVSWAVLLPLLPVVPREESRLAAATQEGVPSAAAVAAETVAVAGEPVTSELAQPLLTADV